MYKVFFNDRKVFLTDDFQKHFNVKYGLFYKYQNKGELEELLGFYRNLKKIDTLYIFHSDIEELRNTFRTCYLNINAAGGLVKNKEGRILIIKRRNRWDLPKGKSAPEENMQQTAIREVSEECGISNIEITKPLLSTYHTYAINDRPVLKRTTWFEMLYTGSLDPVPQIKEHITEVKWFDKSELGEVIKNTYQLIVDVFRCANLI
ncbi:MAG: NUDIX domain-containing protein [Bacteroidales bacterium]|nr:MAG: NUDIX domain-containing protein [Bacteroidales bacterium]